VSSGSEPLCPSCLRGSSGGWYPGDVDATADILRRMVEGFPADVEAIQAGVIDGRTPPAARAVLAAALVYVVEPIDLTPDHLEGLGLIDDAAILRLAARLAVGHGAAEPELRRLAGEAYELPAVFDDLVGPLQAHLEGLQAQPRRGRTPEQVISDQESRMELWQELARRREGYRPHALVAQAMDPAELVKTLRKLVRARLAKAGLVAR
jgi:uncharacterized membrane protein YkvA (DUF1232 family)